MDKIIIWALFDSGNGCYKQASEKYDNIEVYSVGLDIQNQNDHFINLNLAQYEYGAKENILFKELDKLPKPDVIIASPPCESWSVASSMKNGNACWKQEQVAPDLFSKGKKMSRFTIREKKEYERYQFIYEKSFIKRVNGELCTFNLIEIIKHYNPRYFIIENPSASRIWDYIEKVMDFELKYENPVKYGNYDNYPIPKPTKFKGNIHLPLNNNKVVTDVDFRHWSADYNQRSDIPLSLVKVIFDTFIENLQQK